MQMRGRLTAIIVFVDTVLNLASVTGIGLLRLQTSAVRTHAAFSVVHGLLERVVLPAKDVVAMLAEAGVVSCAEVEGLALYMLSVSIASISRMRTYGQANPPCC